MRRGLIGVAALALGAALSAPASLAQTTTYLYDARGRLLSDATAATDSAGGFQAYAYDPAGNRTGRTQSPASRAQSNLLLPGELLLPGQAIRSSDGRFALALQADGNLVLYFGPAVLWSSGTATGNSLYAGMRAADGNVVIASAGGGAPLWASGATGAGSYLYVQNNGDVVIYTSAHVPVWSTGTCCH